MRRLFFISAQLLYLRFQQDARVVELVDTPDLNNLSAPEEIREVESFKFGETFQLYADGNPELSFDYF